MFDKDKQMLNELQLVRYDVESMRLLSTRLLVQDTAIGRYDEDSTWMSAAFVL
jgi:hypothetical protein